MNWLYNEHHRMSKRFGIIVLVVLQIVLLALPPDVAAYIGESTGYKITAADVTEGGNIRSSSGYKISQDMIGSIVGKAQSQGYKVASGFVYTSATYNNAPVLNPINNQEVDEGALLEFNIVATDADGNSLTLQISNKPSGANFTDNGDNTATFSWTPTHSDAGNHEGVLFVASDGQLKDSEEITITVGDVNRPPVLEPIGNQQVDENTLLVFTTTASDPDNDVLSFQATNIPTGLTFTDNGDGTATVSWTPDCTQAGTYPDITIEVDDGDLSDSETIQITVMNINGPPYFTGTIPDIEGDENTTLVIDPAPYVEDPDGEQLNFSYSDYFDDQGRWITTYNDAGIYTVTATITDGIDTIEQAIQVTVNDINRPPSAELTLSTYTVNKDEAFGVYLVVSDIDGDNMSYTLERDGLQIAFGSIVDTYETSISIDAAGDHIITATVTDSGGGVAPDGGLLTKTIDVIDPNQSRSDFYPVLGDFNGDAVTDLGLHNNSTGVWEIAISDDGEFTSAFDWLSSFGTSKDWATLGGDFNADGYNDIGIYNNTTGECKIALSTGSSFIEQQISWLTFSDASYDWQPLTGDFNGDGKTDFGLYNKKDRIIKVALSNGSLFEALFDWTTTFGGNDESAIVGDFNGDGLADIVLFNESLGSWQVAFSLGWCFEDQGEWQSGYAANKKILISDFNSDGLVDIGYFEENIGSWYYAISNGASFIDKGLYYEGFGSSIVETAHTGDFNGDGILDLATFDQDQDGIERWDIRMGTESFSDLLVEADNGVGGVTTITYDYASKQDNDLLPFPVHVVKSVKITDYKPDGDTPEEYTQEFLYQGGYYSSDDREFRGFALATVTDPITGNYTKTYFHQGKDGEEGALKGQIDKIIAHDGNSREISEVINTYEVKKGGPLDNNLGFPCITEVHTTVYEENLHSVETIDRFEYNSLGNVTQTINEGDITTDIDNKITKTVYARAYYNFNRVLKTQLLDKDENILSQKDFEYDTDGNLIKQIDYLDTGDDSVTQFDYDLFGNLISTTNANGYTVLTDYETTFYQFPETITNVLGHIISYAYEPKFGLVKEITDANGNTTTTVYDTLGRITEERNTFGVVVASYTYPDFNTKVTMQLNLSKTEYTDGLGRNYRTITQGEFGASMKEVATEKFFNNRGLLEKESLPHYIDALESERAYIKYAYDIRGRVVEAEADFPGTEKDAITVTQYLTPLSTKVIDPKGHAKTTIKDVNGNVVEVVEHTSDGDFHTYYQYDLKTNLIQVTDAQGNVTEIFYDSLGRKTAMIDPDTGTTEYTYDAMGNIKTQIDNKGQMIAFLYDEINRLEKKDYESPTMQDVVYTYDALDPPNSTGRLSSVDNGVCQTSYEYDQEGRVIEVTRIISGTTYEIQTAYDILGRIESITYPDGEVVAYTYDENSGLLERVEGSQVYIEDIIYNAQGQILTIQYGNNTQTNYTYSFDQRLQRILTQNQIGNLQDLNYNFDKVGNLSTLIDNLQSNIRTYQYDDLNRLTRAENIPNTSSGYLTYTYQYDAIGNMIYKSDVGSYAYGEGDAGPHAATTVGGQYYYYDANGNMISGRGKDFAYDVENRLTEVDNLGQITTFEYNHSGNRVKKITDNQTITYVGKLYEISDSQGAVVTKKHIFTGSDRSITVESTGQTYYYHSDHLGSSNIITDETGTQVQHTEYQPYGKPTINEGIYDSPYKFTGKELDTTGLYYYGARYYDPEIGRFITPDSYVQNPLDPQTLNRYTYCRNNPLIYIDPSGHIFGFIAAVIIGAVLGGAMAAATGGDIGKGILFGALGGALTAGISSAIFSACPAAAGSLVSKASVYAVSAFASSAAVGAIQGVRGSDLWRSAGISAGVAFAATMVLGSISEAAKKARTPTDSAAVEAGQTQVAEGSLEGNTAKIGSGSKMTVPQGIDPAGGSVAEAINQEGGIRSWVGKVFKGTRIGRGVGNTFKAKLFGSKIEIGMHDIEGYQVATDGTVIEFSEELYSFAVDIGKVHISAEHMNGNFNGLKVLPANSVSRSIWELEFGGTVSPLGPGGPAIHGELHINLNRVFK